MFLQHEPTRLRFESFELDLRTRELRKEGRLIKLQDQPAKLLALLASRAGELVTREQIEKALWSDDEFVEFEHGINTAMRKIREALGEDLEKPRFIETLPRKGYRFIAPVENVQAAALQSDSEAEAPARSFRDKIPVHGQKAEGTLSQDSSETVPNPPAPSPSPARPGRVRQEEFALSRGLARTLFLAAQAGYLAMYCAALYKADALEEALGRLFGAAWFATPVIIVVAMCGIAVRLYLLSSVGLDHPSAGEKFRRLFPVLFVLDTFWATSPLLLTRKIGYGLALGSVAALAYLPFSQRTLMQSIYREPKAAESEFSRAER